MAVSRTDFLTRYPQFMGEPNDYIDAFLSDAQLELSESVCGDDYDRMVYLFTAARLFEQPFAGDQGRFIGGENVYSRELAKLKRRKGHLNR